MIVDLTGRTDVPVAEEVLVELADVCAALSLDFLVVGAAARDLTIHARQANMPVRATEDIDIAVAVRTGEDFAHLSERLERRGAPLHRFEVFGIEVDIVPFGGVEVGRRVRFADDHLLDVTGLQEAYSTSVAVRMPRGSELQVASPAMQTALKVLAWRDRHHDNPKDGVDLRVILSAMSEEPFVDDVWDDDEALSSTDDDIITAASYHVARRAAAAFAPQDGQAVLDVLSDPGNRAALGRDMRSVLAPDLLDAYARGFAAGSAR